MTHEELWNRNRLFLLLQLETLRPAVEALGVRFVLHNGAIFAPVWMGVPAFQVPIIKACANPAKRPLHCIGYAEFQLETPYPDLAVAQILSRTIERLKLMEPRYVAEYFARESQPPAVFGGSPSPDSQQIAAAGERGSHPPAADPHRRRGFAQVCRDALGGLRRPQ